MPGYPHTESQSRVVEFEVSKPRDKREYHRRIATIDQFTTLEEIKLVAPESYLRITGEMGFWIRRGFDIQFIQSKRKHQGFNLIEIWAIDKKYGD